MLGPFVTVLLSQEKCAKMNISEERFFATLRTLWFQLEDMFQLIVKPQGIEKVMIQLKNAPSKVYAIGDELFL